MNKISGLTASTMSHCDRKMWLRFRKSFDVEYTAERRRAMSLGRACEDIVVDDLEARGIHITDRQRKLIGEFGQVLCKIDGIATMPDWRVMLLEIKAVNDRAYKCIVKNGLPDYYASQVQVEMHALKLNGCLFVIFNRNTCELSEPIIQHNKVAGETEYHRIHRVIESEDMPPADKSYKCNMCEYKTFCEFGDLPKLSCRTCANVSIVNGEFACPHGDIACDNHLIHPAFMLALGCEVVSADPVELAIDYGDFVHARAGYKHHSKDTFTSREYVEFFEIAKEQNKDDNN